MIKRIRPAIALIFLSLLIQLIALIAMPAGRVSAIGNTFPQPTVMDDAMAVVARVGGGYQLDATSVSFRVFVPNASSGNATVRIFNACNQWVYGSAPTVFELFRAPASEEPLIDENNGNNLIPDPFDPYWEFTTANCNSGIDDCGGSSNDICASVPVSALQTSTVNGHTDYKTFVVKATHVGSSGGINGFRVGVPQPVGSYVSFRELTPAEANNYNFPSSYQSFALLDQGFPGPAVGDAGFGAAEDDYILRFAASCDYSNTTAFIKWSDADYGASNEDGDISFRLINESNGNTPVNLTVFDSSGNNLGTNTTISGNLIGGNESSEGIGAYRAARFDVNTAVNEKYRWEWNNVQDRNGIQIWMPFNELNYQQTCPPTGGVVWGYDRDCSAISVWAANSGDPSEIIDVQIYVRLASSTAFDTSNVVAANQATPPSPVAGNHGYTYTIPAAQKSSTDATVFSIFIYPGTPQQQQIVTTESIGICGTGGGGGGAPPSCDYGNFSWYFGPPDGYANDLFVGGTWSIWSNVNSASGPAAHTDSINLAPYVSGTSQTFANVNVRWDHYDYNSLGNWVVLYSHYQSAGGSWGPCAWEYSVGGSSTPSPTPIFPKPGASVSSSGAVTNSGWGAGPDYTVRVQPTGPGAPYVNPSSRFYGGGGLAGTATPGGGLRSRNHSFGTWTVANNAVHGQRFCITAYLSPVSGPSHPFISTTYSGPMERDLLPCYYIFNLRFDINDSIPMTFLPDNIFPGDNSSSTAEVTVDYHVANNDEAERTAQYPGSEGGTAYGLTYTTTVSGTSGATLVSNTNPDSVINWREESTGTARISVPSTALPGQTVCLTVTVSPERGYSILNPVSEREAAGMVTSETICERVGEQPYIEVHEADVWAGGEWDPDVEGGFWCQLQPPRTTSEAFIKTARRGSVGAFVQYAATALSSIEEFVTTGAENEDLIFQNDTAPLGFYNTSEGRCVVDYFEYLTRDTSDPNVDAYSQGDPINTTGQFYAGDTTDIALSGDTVGTNQMILIVDGDVTINGNISYGNYNITDVEDTPFFMVVASGAIDIAQNVTELDGVYVSKATIDTCYNGSTRLSLTVCPQQLIINGMFIADDVQFRRTFSGVIRNRADLDDRASEHFQFSPELYLAQPPFVSNYSRNFKVDQIKDLPPVY